MRNLLDLADRYLVGGCLGMFRLPDEVATVFHRGEGSRIFDVTGKEYIDYVLGSGPLILGHAHPAIVAAVREQVGLGSTFYGHRVVWPIVDPYIVVAVYGEAGDAAKFPEIW